MDRLDARLAAKLQTLKSAGLARALPPLRRIDAVRYALDGQPVVGFCSNDYLALASDHAFDSAAEQADPGAGASRLIAGDWPAIREAEAALASALGTPDAVLFPSGYQANVAALSALVVPGDCVYSDALAHASLIDGIRLSRARKTILPHATSPPLPTREEAPWWITESIFSMDGDRCDGPKLKAHAAAGGLTYVDEAHAFGLFPNGGGLLRHLAITPTVTVGTLGKAYGSAGAAVGASAVVCHYLRTRARGFVFSTGVSPATAARLVRVCEYLSSDAADARRLALWDNARHLAGALARVFGSDATAEGEAAPSPIFPLIIGENEDALRLSHGLLSRGFHVQAIRPPTVPAGTARLRITVSSAHSRRQIDELVSALRDLSVAVGASPRLARGACASP